MTSVVSRYAGTLAGPSTKFHLVPTMLASFPNWLRLSVPELAQGGLGFSSPGCHRR